MDEPLVQMNRFVDETIPTTKPWVTIALKPRPKPMPAPDEYQEKNSLIIRTSRQKIGGRETAHPTAENWLASS